MSQIFARFDQAIKQSMIGAAQCYTLVLTHEALHVVKVSLGWRLTVDLDSTFEQSIADATVRKLKDRATQAQTKVTPETVAGLSKGKNTIPLSALRTIADDTDWSANKGVKLPNGMKLQVDGYRLGEFHHFFQEVQRVARGG